MNGKRARKIRKLLGIELPIKADLRIMKETEKFVYFPKPITGEMEMVKSKRVSVLNAAKHQYKQAKKQLKGYKIPNKVKESTNNNKVSAKENETKEI